MALILQGSAWWGDLHTNAWTLQGARGSTENAGALVLTETRARPAEPPRAEKGLWGSGAARVDALSPGDCGAVAPQGRAEVSGKRWG